MKSIRPVAATRPARGNSAHASSQPRGAADDAALAAAIDAHKGNLVAAAAAVGVSPARAWKRVQVDDAFVGVRASVDAWVAQHTASAAPPRGASPLVAEHRRQAALAEAGAIAATSPEAKVVGLHRAVHHWLAAARAAPSLSGGAARVETTNALRCVDALIALTADDAAAPWPAVRAALVGDIDGCARSLPLSLTTALGPDVAAAVRDAGAAATIDRLWGMASRLSRSASAEELEAVVGGVVAGIDQHPHAATRCAAVAVEAYARAGRLDVDGPGVGRALRKLGDVIHRAATIEGASGASRALVLEADIFRMAGRFRRARSLLAAARDATHDPTQRRAVALAQVRMEHAAGRPDKQLDALARLRTGIDDASGSAQGAEQALLGVLAAQAWVDAAARRRPPLSSGPRASSLARSLHGLARGALAALGAARPDQRTGPRASTSTTPPSVSSRFLDAARAELAGARAALGPGGNATVVAAVDHCQRQLRAVAGAKGADPTLALDIGRIVRALEVLPLARAAGIPFEALFDTGLAVDAAHVGGRTGALLALARAPRSARVPSGADASVEEHRGDGIDAALAAVLRARAGTSGGAAVVADAAIGLQLATRLTPAPRPVAPRLPDDVGGRLQAAFGDVAAALGNATPTAGPETQDDIVRRLGTLGFAVRSGAADTSGGADATGSAVVLDHVGDDSRFTGAVVQVTPRRFAGVGDDVHACEVALGAEVVDGDGERSFVRAASHVHIGALVFSAERWQGVQRGYEETLARAAAALRTVGGRRLRPGSLAEVRTLISLGRGDGVDGVGSSSRLARVRDLHELHQLQRRITERAAALKAAGILEGFHLEIGEENAAGKTTIGQMAIDAVGEAGFRTRNYSPKAPTAQERAQHPIQRHIDNGPAPGEAVFSDRTMAGSYAYNAAADDAWLEDMAVRRRAWDDTLREAGIAQLSLQVNPGRTSGGVAIDDYAAQTSIVMGKREARAAVARHLLCTLADDELTSEQRAGLQEAAAAGPGYRDLESLHTGEQAALRAEHFARTVSNPANEWGFIGSFERHPSRVQILQAVVDKLDSFAAQAHARAQELAPLFSGGAAMPVPQEPAAKAAWLGFVGAVAARGTASDVVDGQCDGVAARCTAGGRVELVLRLKKKPGDPDRMSRAEILDRARAMLPSNGTNDVDVRIFDPAVFAA